jgi:putative oxidoreductase
MDWGKPYASQLLSILRIVTALVFLGHGLQKLIGFPPAPFTPVLNILGLTGHGSLPGLLIAAAFIEVVFGFLLLIGLWTRGAAFILSGEMAVGYWYYDFRFGGPTHHGNLFPTLNGGDAAVLLCFICLYLFAAGAGAWAVDAGRTAGKKAAYAA